MQRRTIISLIVWVLLALVLFVCGLFSEYWRTWFLNQSLNMPARVVDFGNGLFSLAPANPLRALLISGLIVFPLWFLQPPNICKRNKLTVYGIWWLFIFLFIVVVASPLIQFIHDDIYAVPYLNVGTLLATWTALVIMGYIYWGDKSESYYKHVSPHRSFFIMFAVAILVSFLSLLISYDAVDSRVRGLTAGRELVVTQLENTKAALDLLRQYRSNFSEALGKTDKNEITKLWVVYNEENQIANRSANDALNWANQVIQAEANDKKQKLDTNTDRDSSGVELSGAVYMISNTVAATNVFSNTFKELATPYANAVNDRDVIDFETQLEAKLFPRLDLAYDSASKALTDTRSVQIIITAIFLGTAILFSVFVLYPWFLLLLFFFRERDNLVNTIVKDLLHLGEGYTLLMRVLGVTDVEDDNVPLDMSGIRGFLLRRNQFHVRQSEDSILCEQSVLLKCIKAIPPERGGRIQEGEDTVARIGRMEVVKAAMADRAFSTAEYILSLVVLTAIIGVGWYFVLYPITTTGLSVLILDLSGIVGFANYLKQNLTPITAGFIGAYSWMAFMLMRRYFYGDLYPTAFWQLVERFVRVFMYSVIFSLLAGIIPASQNAGISNTTDTPKIIACGVAFFIGVYPQEGLAFLTELVNRISNSVFPKIEELAPLTRLDGLNRYMESRFLEENIENIQGLVTTRIEELVANTYFSTTQIVDWIDQALLYAHCGQEGEWFPLFRSTGIRGASDLLDALGFDLSTPADQITEDLFDHKEHDPQVKRLVNAINDAQTHNQVKPLTALQVAGAVGDQYAHDISATVIACAAFQRLTDAIPETGPAAPNGHGPGELADLIAQGKQLKTALDALAKQRAELQGELKAIEMETITHQVFDKALVQTANSTNELVSNTDEANTALENLNAQAGGAFQQNAPWRLAVKRASASAQKLSDDGAKLASELGKFIPPLRLTAPILLEIHDQIWPDPNIKYILNWYRGLRNLTHPETAMKETPEYNETATTTIVVLSPA